MIFHNIDFDIFLRQYGYSFIWFTGKLCGKSFPLPARLALHHANNHDGSKNEKCSFCEKTFARKSDLKVHERIHTGEKPYSCSHCLQRFTLVSNRNMHMSTHAGEKLYDCSICMKRFTQKSTLTRHIKKSHIAKVIKEEFTFGEESNRQTVHHENHSNVHMLTEVKEKNFECSICMKRFVQKSTLNRHMKNSHIGNQPFQSTSICEQNNLENHVTDHLENK